MPRKSGTKPEKKEKILVLSVDRDNDLGEKAGISGPVMGRAEVINAGTRLAVADPEESDANAVFQAVKVYDELKRQYSAEVSVLTGDKNVGVHSDKEISRQLEMLLKKFRADYVVFVTDGTEDEHIMPIIQSRVPILSVKRVIVRQAEELESTYFKIKDFIEESLENPKFARLVFGLPAIILILYALFGAEGWRIILGIFGIYLVIKGFKLEHYFEGVAEELGTSLTRRRFAFFLYIVGIALGILATYRGFISLEPFLSIGIFESAAAFVFSSIYFYFLAGAVAWIGRNVGLKKKRRIRNVIAVIIFGFAISLVVYNAAELIINPDLSIFNFIISIILGFILIFIALMIELKG